jgi:hypothetical protein
MLMNTYDKLDEMFNHVLFGVLDLTWYIMFNS